MAKVEILTGTERQRRWSTELKLSILQEAFSADGSVSDVARRHDVLPQCVSACKFGSDSVLMQL
ncbi:transposase [Rhizobium ruizarguesonis]